MNGSLSREEFVRLSLELHLFFLRIMKEHSFFLQAGFLVKNARLANEADGFRVRFNRLLATAVELANGNVSRVVLDSGEVVTDKTLRAEEKTQQLSGVPFDLALTRRELRLTPGLADPDLENTISAFNEKVIKATKALVEFKTRVLEAMLAGQLFTFNFPLLIEHIRREANFFIQHLERLQRREAMNLAEEVLQEKVFWDRIMAEHALFIAHLLDPTETSLIDTADEFAEIFERLDERAIQLERHGFDRKKLNGLVREETRATESIRDFKATATELILANEIRSIIIPLLGDHVLREADHFLRILKHPETLEQLHPTV
jgi:hypothetical protein